MNEYIKWLYDLIVGVVGPAKQTGEASLDDNSLVAVKESIKKLQDEDPLVDSRDSWQRNRNQLRLMFLSGDLGAFLKWDVIKRTMIYNAPLKEYWGLRKNWSMWRTAIIEDRIGMPESYKFNNRTSGTLVHHAYHLQQIIGNYVDAITDFDMIIEFGGGYGSMCRLISNLGFTGDYVIFDLPEFSILQKSYLISIRNKPSNLSLVTKLDDLISFGKSCNKILLIATWSLSEAPLDVRKKFLEFVDFDYALLAYQDTFDGVDNNAFFDALSNKNKGIQWKKIPIKHLPGNAYLIGFQK
jgi:hypothetical protein